MLPTKGVPLLSLLGNKMPGLILIYFPFIWPSLNFPEITHCSFQVNYESHLGFATLS
jgi:hypothetical protein